jgi:dTDP-4-dehydrorhamnose 3,5-epimerase
MLLTGFPDGFCGEYPMQFQRLEIEDILLIEPSKHGDRRGFFSETYRNDLLRQHDVNADFLQDNHVYSAQRGVLRGLHFQIPPHAQGKLVRCVRGSILDIGVDIRAGSPTFGHHVAVELSAENWMQLWVPPGFAHGYVTLEQDCEVIYKTTDYYAKDCERGLAWDDPALGIDWRIARSNLVISDKDTTNPPLTGIQPFFRYDRRSA